MVLAGFLLMASPFVLVILFLVGLYCHEKIQDMLKSRSWKRKFRAIVEALMVLLPTLGLILFIIGLFLERM